MKKTMKTNSYWILSILLIALISCQKENDFDNQIENMTFNDAVESLGYLDEVSGYPEQEISEPQEIEVVEAPGREEGTDLECSVVRYKATPGYNELFLLDPTSDVIYPGALMKGESIATGEYTPIIASRKPITLSISLQNLDGDIAVDVDEPKLSTVRKKINEILSSNVNGATPAKINFEIQEVHSREQLNLAVGANYQNATSDISGSFAFGSEEIKSRVMVKFMQIYYTIDMDIPENPSDLFTSLPDIEDLGSISPMYVSTVKYGRMVLFSATSSRTTTEVRAALNAAFESGVTKGEIDITGDHKKVIEESEIQAYVIGGSGGDASGIVNGISGLKNYIINGGNYSKDSPGAMLAYKMRFLKDNSIGKVLLSSEYNVRQCDQAYYRYEVILQRIICTECNDGAGSHAEMAGSMKTKISGSSKTRTLWSESKGHAIDEIGGIIELDNSTTWEFYKPDRDKAYIEISGNLIERDATSADDNLGGDSKRIFLSDLTGLNNYELIFNGSGMTAKSTWRIIGK